MPENETVKSVYIVTIVNDGDERVMSRDDIHEAVMQYIMDSEPEETILSVKVKEC